VSPTTARYEKASIAEAKAFAKSNLPHRISAPNQPTKYRLARPGERKDENGEVQHLIKNINDFSTQSLEQHLYPAAMHSDSKRHMCSFALFSLQAAQLYSVWFNGVSDLDEFGIGVSLYFRQLLFFAGALALCVVSTRKQCSRTTAYSIYYIAGCSLLFIGHTGALLWEPSL
jgi:hypothetical protein